MREFDRPIGRVWRRLRFQRFLTVLVWCLSAGLLVTAGWIALEKLSWAPRVGPSWLVFVVPAAVSVLGASLLALLRGPSRADAAFAIDHEFELRERVGTAYGLGAELRETPAGQALIADALRHIEGLDVAAKFGLRAPSKAWLPCLTACLAVGMLFLPQAMARKSQAKSQPLSAGAQAVIARHAEDLKRSLAETRKDIDTSQLSELDKLLTELEKAATNLAKAPPAEKDKALVELNKLTDALKERQSQLGPAEQVARQLQQLQEMATAGPADQLAKDLARGDFDKAAQELQKLKEKLADGKLGDAEKKALENQIGEMKKQLEKLANLEERKKQLDDALRNGALTKDQHAQQMAKLQEQAKNLKQAQQIAQCLGQCQQALARGDCAGAASALGMTEQELQQMAQQMKELDALDGALADLQECKAGMCQGGDGPAGNCNGGNGNNLQPKRGRPGRGLGRGVGDGERPEAEDNVAFHTTKTPSQYGKGKAYITGFGPPQGATKGQSQIEVQGELQSAAATAAAALTDQRVPANIKKHVLNYFDQVRKGE